MKNKTFIEITNKDIYEKLEQLENHVLKQNGSIGKNKLQIRLMWGVLAAVLLTLVGTMVK